MKSRPIASHRRQMPRWGFMAALGDAYTGFAVLLMPRRPDEVHPDLELQATVGALVVSGGLSARRALGVAGRVAAGTPARGDAFLIDQARAKKFDRDVQIVTGALVVVAGIGGRRAEGLARRAIGQSKTSENIVLLSLWPSAAYVTLDEVAAALPGMSERLVLMLEREATDTVGATPAAARFTS